ncbi:hypothetical protein LRAMOSA01102 [Lichtheimia ramosa]|uniref:F-box domain-containing protein n=1 Tax=Lichtheimia ramosa TaxID=688394 RepID=A0A077W9M0_9FUNG|nr:hypothetical protein LRAMOSA01102 [Lichtheimia ramosa]
MLNDIDANHWDLESHIESAELYMEDRKYNEAIGCLNAALSLDSGQVDALELRAMAWKALGSAEQFEADIERCIQLAPHRVRPYLIMKDHLISRGKVYEAIQLLHAATFRVYFDDPELVQLNNQFHELKQKEYNHLVQLPAEIIGLVFSFLPLSTLVTCLAVSKKWRSILITIPALWQDIDFGAPTQLKQASVIASIKNFSSWTSIHHLRISLCDRSLGVLMHITGYSVRVDDLLLVMAMRQLGSTWQKVTISSAIRTPRIFFAAAAMFCPHMTSLTIKSFYHATPQDDQQAENDIFNDLGLAADDTAPLVIHSLTMEKSVINTSTLESLFARCAYLQKLVFIQCKSMLSAGRFFSTMMRSLPAHVTINNLTIEQLNVNDYDDCIFGTNPGDLCAMLQTRPPKSLNLNKCEMYREAVQAIVESMQSGPEPYNAANLFTSRQNMANGSG